MENVTIEFNDTLTPIEEIAITPFLEYEIWQNKFNIIESEGWPGKVRRPVFRNAHIKSLNYINENLVFKEFFGAALSKDRKKDIVGQSEVRDKFGTLEFKTDSEWALRQWKLGESYANNMAGKFYELLQFNDVNTKPNFMESNQRAVEWKTHMSKKFKNLSNVAKLAATYTFLNAHLSSMKARNVTAPQWLPPSSDKAIEFQLLEENILRSFVDVFNNEIDNNRNVSTKYNHVIDLAFEQYIEESCG